MVYLAEQVDGSARPAWVVFSAHDETGDDLRRRRDDPDLTVVDGHPVVFAGLGSHSGAYLPGDYLSTFDPPAFGGLVDAFRRVARFFLPWTRHEERVGIGIPYVDYARGDGTTIGPGTGQRWTPQLISDATAWVVDFRGLWGNDTADPLGGERGPAGPRYERSGRVRDCWGDVAEWSGLAKVAPNPQMAADLVSRRMDEVRLEAASVEAKLVGRRETVRATVACGEPVTVETEAELHSLTAQRTALSDEGRRLGRILSDPLPEPGPHEHLRHRSLPQEREPEARHRLLAVWAALNTPLILAAIGLAFRPDNTRSATALILSWIFVLVTIEALARRRLLHFLAILAVVNLAASVVASVAGLTVFFGWRITVMVCFGVLGLLLFLANLIELRRN